MNRRRTIVVQTDVYFVRVKHVQHSRDNYGRTNVYDITFLEFALIWNAVANTLVDRSERPDRQASDRRPLGTHIRADGFRVSAVV